MKRYYIIAVSVVMLMMAGCESKKEASYIIVKEEAPAPKKVEIIATEAYKSSDVVEWRGKNYTYNIAKVCDKEAPVVKDETGQKYYDNKATLTITRDDGSEFYSHTFKKSSFEQYLPTSFVKNGVLEGFVFDKAEEGYLNFIASVAYPESDEFVLFSVKISPTQGVTISKDNRMTED